MPKTTLHLGMPKTGTTSLQKHYFNEWKSINYFGSFGDQASWDVLRIANSAEEYDYQQNRSEYHNLVSGKIDSEIPTLVSKEEVLIGHQYPAIMGYADRMTVVSRLRDLFGECQVVVVLRNQLTFLPSFFAQWQKHWYITRHPFSRWLDAQFASLEKKDGTVLNIPRYDVIFEILKDTFGKPNLHFLFYEQFLSRPDEFIADFAKLVGVQPPRQPGKPMERENARASSARMFLQRIQTRHPNLTKLVPRGLRKKALSVAEFAPPAKLKIHESDLKRIYDFYEKGNRQFEKQTDIELGEYGYPI